jgi:hypothetical protein
MDSYFIFRVIVYMLSIYLIICGSTCVNISLVICGIVIFVSHLYKDLTNMKKWPKWTEYGGTILGLTLIINGIKCKKYCILILGIIKLSAHIRQFITNDDQYYPIFTHN